jgi:hypothetical protein
MQVPCRFGEMFIKHNKGYTKWSWEIEYRNHKTFTDNISSEQISDKHKEMLPEIVTLSEICEHKDMSSCKSTYPIQLSNQTTWMNMTGSS